MLEVLNLAVDYILPLYVIIVVYLIFTLRNYGDKSNECLSFKLTKSQPELEDSSKFNWREKMNGRFLQYEISSGFADTWLSMLRKPYAARLIAPSMMLRHQFDYATTDQEFGVEMHFGDPKKKPVVMTIGTSFENAIPTLGTTLEGQMYSFRSWVSDSEPDILYTNLTPPDPKEKSASLTCKREMLDVDTIMLVRVTLSLPHVTHNFIMFSLDLERISNG
jgi:hypothetical protein